ncbi:MAG: hypothetical protein ACK47M_25280 [Caldilinea sp.]
MITVGAAKWRVHNFLQKLDVNNRCQAIAQAHKPGAGEPAWRNQSYFTTLHLCMRRNRELLNLHRQGSLT